MTKVKKIEVVFQGIVGSYTHTALNDFAKKFSLNVNPIENTGFFRELFEVINNSTFIGFIPIENSTAGFVLECYDLLEEYDFEIIGEQILKIDHTLLAKKGVKFEDIKKIYSHPQALSQCSNFLEKNHLEKLIYNDTAGASKFVSEENSKQIGAISSKICAKLYDLDIIKENIQNLENNHTKFILAKKRGYNFDFEEELKKGVNSIRLIFQVKDEIGSLYNCLGIFAKRGINQNQIVSRPSKNPKFTYVFHIAFEGNLNEELVKEAISELREMSEKVQVCGNFKSCKEFFNYLNLTIFIFLQKCFTGHLEQKGEIGLQIA